jgi:U2 small nuclear ribonucleoprotein B''
VISYAKSKSDFVAKLDGTFQLPAFGGDKQNDAAVIGEKGTALQQSVFGGPPPSAAQGGAQGQKRLREEEEQEDVAMEEDEEDMEMDESDDD